MADLTARQWLLRADNDGFIELVEDRSRGMLVGATATEGEVLGMLAFAVHADLQSPSWQVATRSLPSW